ncbi:MAG: hypothetical protein IKU62_02885 [Ruminiclostridium sp.]|nr:hypothetical protein [Ruminiclostridium sp.]
MAGKSGLKLREVNLELGKPSLDHAMKRLAMEVTHSRSMQCAVLKIIHGYGSSGTGGKIRTVSRRYLSDLKKKGEIRDVIPGESFSIFEEATRQAFSRCDALRRDEDLDRYNNGVTFILL